MNNYVNSNNQNGNGKKKKFKFNFIDFLLVKMNKLIFIWHYILD